MVAMKGRQRVATKVANLAEQRVAYLAAKMAARSVERRGESWVEQRAAQTVAHSAES